MPFSRHVFIDTRVVMAPYLMYALVRERVQTRAARLAIRAPEIFSCPFPRLSRSLCVQTGHRCKRTGINR